MIFDAFDQIRIVNLPHRRDRREQMKAELARVGLADDPRVSFFPAVRPHDRGDFSSIGARGCYESHVAILQEAVARGESVLILEDDCDFAPTARAFEAEDFELLYGGYFAQDPSNLQTSDIAGSHMMGFSAAGAQRVSEYLRKLSYTGAHPPIDAAYVWFRRAHPDVRTSFAEPPIAHQRPSRTDIADLAFYDRVHGLRALVSGLRGAKRLLTRTRRS